MAVTKIRKMSSSTLLTSVLISVAVLIWFFTGGVVDPAAEMVEYVNTDKLLYWVYLLFGLTIASTVGFALMQFFSGMASDVKGAMTSILSIVVFAGIFCVAYALGDGTPLQGLNADSQAYNVESWLKMTDMWIYTTYILLAIIVVVAVMGSVKKIIGK